MPTALFAICNDIMTDPCPFSFDTSISKLGVAEMIAFTGFLLEYPISYFPMTMDSTAFFPNEPLDVFTCVLTPSDSDAAQGLG